MKALSGALLRVLGSHLEAAEVARLRCACHSLHAALAHDVLWRQLYACAWGPVSESSGSPLAELSWCERFAGRAAQRERWRRGVCESTHLARRPASACQYRTVMHEETLFVTASHTEVLVFALPELRHTATWLPHGDGPPGHLNLWLCGTGPTTRLVTYMSGGSIRCWSPHTLASLRSGDPHSSSQPQPELELAWSCAAKLCTHSPREPCPVQWLWAMVFDDRHFTALAVGARTVIEWSRETGCCLRQWSFPGLEIESVYAAQYDGCHLLVGTARLRVHPDDDDGLDSARLWSCTPLRGFVQRYCERRPVPAPVASFVFPDIARPRATPLTYAQCGELSARLHSIPSCSCVYDLAVNERFLVILWQDETLTVHDYGLALPPRHPSAVLQPKKLRSSP